MKIHFLVCILCNFLFAKVLAENPQSLLFNRDSVEFVPEHSSSENVKKPPFMSLEEYGSKSLPLRTAVESVPDLTQNSQRLPLRDAVEKRPLPQDLLQRQIYQPFLSSSSQFIDPYRITNYYQQLILSPFSFQQARNLELAHSNEEKKIVCYFEAAAVYRKPPLTFTAEDLDANLCTHLVYAYASLNTQDFKVTSNDEEYDVIQGGFKSVVALKQFNRNLKVLLAIGGPREEASHKFSKMVKNPQSRRNFIESALNITQFFEFDGIEIHWEYPEQKDKENFQLLLEELSEVFKKSELILALVGPKSNIEDGFYVSKLNEIVDFVNIQTYDYHKEKLNPAADHHAPLFFRSEDETLISNADYSIKSWIMGGLNRKKIILGIPFFGRSFTLQYLNDTKIGAPILGPGKEGFYTQKPGFLAYFEICDMLVNEGWFRNEDSNGSPFITNGNQWVAFEDASTIKKKANYVTNNNLGGTSVYAVDLDDFKALCGEKWPLLRALYKNLNNREHVPLLETNSENPAVKPYGTCKSEGYYSDPKNCAAYYICKNGLSYHLSCGDNKMFDSTNGKCTRQIRNCRPGEMIYLHQNLKKLNQELFRDNTPQNDDELKVVCYVTNWAFYRKADGKFVPENIDQRLCTHIVYAFASLDAETLQIKEFDNWADIDNNLYERVTSLKDSKVLLSLGGWTDSTGDKYSKLVSDGSARRRFVVGIISFLRRHGFRGLHFDWNYPICWQSNCKKGPASDKPNFSKLIQELEKEFSKQSPPLILAASIAGYKEVIDVAYDLSALGQNLDFISVMTYDYHGAWEGRTGHVSPLYSKPDDKYPQYSTNFTMEYLVSKGAPREKLLVGIPFYGQTFSLTKSNSFIEGTSSNGPGEAGEYTKQPGMLSYYEICYRIKNHNWLYNKGKYGSGSYAYLKNQWVGFEDIESVKEKANYIRTAGFGGAVAWTIDLDDFNNKCCSGSFPLLRSLNHALGRINSAPVEGADCSKPPAPSTPSPPETTTGVDSGSATSEHHHTEWTTQKTSTSTWWSTEKTSTTQSWWSSTSSLSTTQQSTKKPQNTTIPWWQQTTKKPAIEESSTIIPPPAVIKPEVDDSSISKSCEPGQYLPDPNNYV